MSTFKQSPPAGTLLAAAVAGSSAFTPASLTPTLPLQIADRIGAAIVEELFAPGGRLKEGDLANAFGVSRASVREALRILESRGLVRILPQRGAQVTLLSRAELENLFEIRAVLLGLAARQAARNYGAASGSALSARLARLAETRGDANAYARASAEMVEFVAHLSTNEQLAELIAAFAQRIGRYTRLGLASPDRRARSLANWRRLAQAIVANDEKDAEDINRRLALENRDAALMEVERRVSGGRTEPARRARTDAHAAPQPRRRKASVA
ncbi:MAG TPA: GntR family transcriptional regulator [Casimicrobiaceae bacterium]|nr:GntR family transcriptional regulator [Casimicrobiaceae bacterium]